MSKILICIDGSQYSKSVCEYGAWAARRLGADLEVVYVTDLRQFEIPFVADLSGSLGLQPYQSVMGELQTLEEKKGEIILEQAAAHLSDSGFDGVIEKTHRTGFLVDSLSDLEESADMIVIGKRGENANFAAEHLGSTMERVARAASKPCLVSSRAFNDVKRVLVAYQNVESCHSAIDYLRDNQLLADAEIHLVSVSKTDGESVVLSDLKQAEERLADAGYHVTAQMLHGVVPQVIANYAKETKIDMLVMGAYGHSKIRHLIIGSTTTELLRDCKLPTLLFR